MSILFIVCQNFNDLKDRRSDLHIEGRLSDFSMEGLYKLAENTVQKALGGTAVSTLGLQQKHFRLEFYDDDNGLEISNMTRATFENLLSLHGQGGVLRISLAVTPGSRVECRVVDIWKQALTLICEQKRVEQLESSVAAIESRLATVEKERNFLYNLCSDFSYGQAAKRARR